MTRRAFSLSVTALEQMCVYCGCLLFLEKKISFFCYVSGGWKPKHGANTAWHLMKTHLKHPSMARGSVVRRHGLFSSTKATNAITRTSPSWPHQIPTTSLEPALRKLTFLLMRQKIPILGKEGFISSYSLRGLFHHGGEELVSGRKVMVARAEGQLITLHL